VTPQEYSIFFGAAFLAVLLLGLPAIHVLRTLSIRQKTYELAPQTHEVKTGTPTMGGLLFAFVLLLLAAYFELTAPRSVQTTDLVKIVALGLACGAIGFADDLISILRGHNRGLDGRTKFWLTAIVASVFLVSIGTFGHASPAQPLFPEWLWYALAFVAVTGTTHAVNLTDGLDGLAAGTIVPPLAVFSWIAIREGWSGVAVVDLVTIAAVLAFLVYNRYPARLIMGDTGSLLLGGILAGSAIVLHRVLLLPLVGAVFAAEALSVILQVAYFKRTHKRIFKKSPLHHHFEESGWPETKVTHWFWAASALCSVAGVATVLATQGAVP
jgi:phospho-N-acetylmuramoyl-pentapeptide-transferase